MSVENYMEKIKNIYDIILEFLESEADVEEDFQNFSGIINGHKICIDKHEFALFLHLISKISENHHRNPNFITKFEKIIRNYEKDIKQNLTNTEIFNIFKGNKRILLFLFDEKIIIMNKCIIELFFTTKYRKAKYPQYFSPEIRAFMNEKWFKKQEWAKEIEIELPSNFNDLRKIGENENFICELIRNDSIDEFIKYVNKNNNSLRSSIPISIFETNSYLIKKQIESNDNPSSRKSNQKNENKLTLIKYAAFFGSFQILKYLQLSGFALTPQLWIFAVYGQSAEIIHLLEENLIKPKEENKKNSNSDQNLKENPYEECLMESIKCHHNNIANYILDCYFQVDERKSDKFFNQSLKSYNFPFIQNELINENAFFCMCKCDYYSLVKMLLNNMNVDVNKILKSLIIQ